MIREDLKDDQKHERGVWGTASVLHTYNLCISLFTHFVSLYDCKLIKICAKIFPEALFIIANNEKQLSHNRNLVKIKYGLYML